MENRTSAGARQELLNASFPRFALPGASTNVGRAEEQEICNEMRGNRALDPALQINQAQQHSAKECGRESIVAMNHGKQ